jgi:toxin ParE1/3/4
MEGRAARIEVTSRAAGQVAAAAEWYELERSGLGMEFVAEFDRLMWILREFPNWGAIRLNLVRRVLLRRFPYAVYYTLESGTLTVLSVQHLRRDIE